MSIFCCEERPNSPKKCKFLGSALKDTFCNCHNFGGRISTSSLEDDNPSSDFDDEQDVVVSIIRSRAMEAKSRRNARLMTDSFCWGFSPMAGELFITSKEVVKGEKDDKTEDFFSVESCFSQCSSAASRDEFVSVKTSFSRCSSLNGLDFQDFWRRSIIEELCHCEGWPFGLCRKAVLLPPLPKSPSESWSWHKGNKMFKMP